MTALDLTLDHVGIVVADLAVARETFTRLGFQLTRESSHKAALTPGGPVEMWGSGNRCAMFAQGYFEILGITDPARHHVHIDERLARYSGLHLIALGSADVAAAGKLVGQSHDGVQPMMELHRDVPFGATETRPGMFRIVYLDEALFPDAELFFIEHATPDVLWQPDLLTHPNGVTGLAGATLCTDDPAATAKRFVAITGIEPVTGTDGAASFPLRVGEVDIIDRAGLARRFPGIIPPTTPWLAATTFRVSDLDKTRACLDANGLAINERDDGSIWVAPDAADGAIIAFV